MTQGAAPDRIESTQHVGQGAGEQAPGAEPTRTESPKKGSALKVALIAAAVLVVAILGIRLVNTLSVSPLEKAAEACELPKLIVLADEGKTMMLHVAGEDGREFGDVTIDEVACILSETDVPTSVVSHIDSTRALDGQQTAEWGKIAARWSYHPSSGLNLVLTTR